MLTIRNIYKIETATILPGYSILCTVKHPEIERDMYIFPIEIIGESVKTSCVFHLHRNRMTKYGHYQLDLIYNGAKTKSTLIPRNMLELQALLGQFQEELEIVIKKVVSKI
jgi:hypothetical protein